MKVHVCFALLSYRSCQAAPALRLLHSFIFQVVSYNKNLRSILCQAFEANQRQVSSCVDTTRDILKSLTGDAPVHIIVDGLDEINAAERFSALKNLLRLNQECPNLKLLVSSRGEHDIFKLLNPCAQMIRVHDQNGQDIQEYVRSRVDEWMLRLDLEEDDIHDLKVHLEPMAKRSKGESHLRVIPACRLSLRDLYASQACFSTPDLCLTILNPKVALIRSSMKSTTFRKAWKKHEYGISSIATLSFDAQ